MPVWFFASPVYLKNYHSQKKMNEIFLCRIVRPFKRFISVEVAIFGLFTKISKIYIKPPPPPPNAHTGVVGHSVHMYYVVQEGSPHQPAEGIPWASLTVLFDKDYTLLCRVNLELRVNY